MSKKKKTDSNEQLEAVESALSKSERYIEENQKSLTIIVAVIVIIIGIYLGYRKFYLAPIEKEAQSQMFVAEQYFEVDSFSLALHGDGNYLGFLDIIDEYGVTKSANLAQYYAGISYLQMGQYEDCIEHLKDFNLKDKMIAPIALGAIGDSYVQLENYDDAIVFYKKAANEFENEFTSPIYLLKLGLLYESMNDYTKAIETYEEIKSKYPNSTEGQEIDKYITKAKVNAEQ